MRSVAFSVPGAVPSKSNYRKANTKASRELWKRIKKYESEVGQAAMAAGARRHMGRGKVELVVVLVNQALDLDNALKCPIDGLKHVAFEDDSPEHLDRVMVLWRQDAGDPRPRVEYRIEWRAP